MILKRKKKNSAVLPIQARSRASRAAKILLFIVVALQLLDASGEEGDLLGQGAIALGKFRDHHGEGEDQHQEE
ncbi:hypothetical protein D3C83_158980 [compost metagenome]